MDRVKSSMQQVPNAIPKVIRRTGGANSLELERENFERGQAVSINKAINTQEVAVKEKHARNILTLCILGTHHEKGAHTFWAAVNRLPLSSNAVLCWKFCHVFHKLLRDGHPNLQVIKDSMRNKADLADMSRMWGHLSEGYGKLCSIYLKLLITKMEFHIKFQNPRFPGNLQMSNRQLDEAGENDVNNFQLTVEMFDYLECELNLFLGFNSLDMSRSVSVTAAGQCRLAPLIQVILDCSHLYDYTVKLLFKLHSDTLQGHRDRFQEQFKLKSLFYRSSNLQYFKRLIQIPQLPEQNPPNFLRASALSEHISPVVVIPAESSSPESEHVVETEDLVDTDVPSLPKFDDLFGTSAAIDPFNFNSQNGMRKDDRLIEQLTREIQALKEELESFRLEQSGRLCQALRGRVNELEAELAEQSHLRLQAAGESEFLKAELDDLRRAREDTEKEQRSLTEIEKAQANEQRYTKLKEKYTELVQSHAELLRKNAEVTRQMTVARAAQDEVEAVRREMQEKVKSAHEAADRQEREQVKQLQELQRELVSTQTELDYLKTTMASSQQMQSSEVLGTQLVALESEKAELVQTLSKVEAELAVQGEELQRVQSSLATERESGVKTAEALQNQLNEKQESREQALESQLVAARWSSLQGAVEEAERIIQDSLAQIDDPAHISCTSSAYLVSRCQASLDSVERLQSAREAFLADNTAVLELVRVVTQCGHLVGDTIVQGSATSHMVPVEQADLSESVKTCGSEALALLGQMKQRDALASADGSKLRASLEAILTTAEQKLRPRGLELQQGELGDLVEQEMAATSAAVESAAARIEEMLNKSRAVDTGIKMEVNEILASCTELMQAIKELILSSKDLQRDIVESGRQGAASMKEFYAKNSRWTEGLISASKAVGWGATVMDAADMVVQGKGKFEELMVCSHEIAASTAQLVAASKVKADKDSANLHRLQQASRGVTQATATVVASTKSGKSQIEDTTMDFSSMTLTQIKRQEMDAQVLVLELETRLQKERERLGELRKKHYELAGVAEGWGEEEE
uniref:Huntingtin-interacting protein 1-related protein n=1 Tax=Poecilia latipinna TaxID=48699 RepID=A0A3B3U5P3_9TELE